MEIDKHEDSIRTIKCRGIIVYEGQMLVVKHSEKHDFYAMPGGHLEGGENPKECIDREIFEEFNTKPEIGRLIYLHQYNSLGKNFLEFYFEIKNSADFKDLEENKIDRNEILDLLWVSRDNNLKILPEKINEDFKNGILGSGELQFIE